MVKKLVVNTLATVRRAAPWFHMYAGVLASASCVGRSSSSSLSLLDDRENATATGCQAVNGSVPKNLVSADWVHACPSECSSFPFDSDKPVAVGLSIYLHAL